MALVNRVSRLFRADLHAVLDRLEEPETLLRQAVRDMEEELASDERRAKLLRHELDRLVARRAEIERSLSAVNEELDVCFACGKDDLARATIRRKLQAQRLDEHLERKGHALQETLAALESRASENRARLESMRQKAELLVTPGADEPSGDVPVLSEVSVRDEEIEVAFLREKRRRARS